MTAEPFGIRWKAAGRNSGYTRPSSTPFRRYRDFPTKSSLCLRSEAVLPGHAVEPDDPHGSDGGVRLQGGRRPRAGDPVASKRRQDADRPGAHSERQKFTHRAGEPPGPGDVHLRRGERRRGDISERHSYRTLWVLIPPSVTPLRARGSARPWN